MSIQSEISRIQSNVQDTINVIQSTGVTVPSGATSDNLPGLATALANEKQDKLTGQQGQVVGFDAEGNAVAQSPASSGVTSFEGRTGAVTAQQGDYTAAMVGAVPTTRTVNGKALSANVEIGAADVDVTTDTASLYGLEDATVDEVLQVIPDNLDKVGDVKVTARTDLGENWLLCNGDEIDAELYPELANVMDPFSYSGIWEGHQISDTSIEPQSVACYNGTWVAVGRLNKATRYPHILITTDPSGTWTVRQISNTLGSVVSIACYNGTWVAVGSNDTNNLNRPYI